ncbi:MAG: hypothetical protein EOO13_05195 [Chitinophagaceae bacterium]|nr:MAG: hypothetical protein EOO13_05195 [Chitinophagaceae bacterium]
MKQLKNKVTILTGTEEGNTSYRTLQFATELGAIVGSDIDEGNGSSRLHEIKKPKREAVFIKGHPAETEDHEMISKEQATISLIDLVGSVILIGIILAIIVLFIFFGNGINIAKPILR